ncbi:MAG TPA: RcnB family protein [Ramlibacter sp.]|nr:RcnB family protein [Ramlibacter sp.]
MRSSFPSARALALVLAAAFAAAPTLAAPPEHAGGGKHGNKHADKDDHRGDRHDRGEEKHGRRDDDRRGDDRRGGDRRDPRPGAYFSAHDRDAVRHYYASSHRSCPPGLAKKHNGCMPPGQAKKWDVGHRLPAGTVIYAVPQPILVTLPPPPPQHRYVRVAGDILLVAVGTQMVVDGISGLMR